jgi:AraC-like DNA-binding protein
MLYKKITPSPPLKPYVECYFVWEYQHQGGGKMLIESPPNGFASMVFNYKQIYQIHTPKMQGVAVPQAFLSGQSTHSYKLSLQGTIGMVGVVFKPAGMGSIFGLPMYEFSDQRTPLSDVLGKAAQEISGRIFESQTHQERINHLEGFLLGYLSRKNITYSRVDYAADLIVSNKGLINLSEIVNEVFLCRRQFERKFLYQVGVSPKYYARIRRVSLVCAQLAANRWQVKDWHDFIHQAGYYDQSHFIKDFVEFIGQNPSLYVKNNLELANFLR